MPRTVQAAQSCPCGMHTGAEWAGWTSGWTAVYTTGFHAPVSTSPPTAQIHRQGLNPQGEVTVDMSCAPTMSQELCFWAPFTDEKPRLGDCSCITQLTWKLAVPKSLSKSAPWEKLVNSFLMRCEPHDSWIHTFHKWKALTMYRSQLLRWRRRWKNSGAIWQEIT